MLGFRLIGLYVRNQFSVAAMPSQVPDSSRPDSSYRSHSNSQLKLQRPLVWLGYLQTKGIAAFRVEERYSVWLFTHRFLKGSDRGYRSACWLFYLQLASCLLAGWLCFGIFRNALGELPALVFAALVLAGAGFIAWSNEQRRRNQAIGARFAAE